MNLIKLETDEKIKAAFGATQIVIERIAGNITRVILGSCDSPIAIIQKAGPYSEHLEILERKSRTVFKSETDFFGAALTKTFDDADDREKWEKDLDATHNKTFVFVRSEVIEFL